MKVPLFQLWPYGTEGNLWGNGTCFTARLRAPLGMLDQGLPCFWASFSMTSQQARIHKHPSTCSSKSLLGDPIKLFQEQPFVVGNRYLP